jgi:hypothetical protein
MLLTVPARSELRARITKVAFARVCSVGGDPMVVCDSSPVNEFGATCGRASGAIDGAEGLKIPS